MEIATYANHLAGITDMDLFERHGAPVGREALREKESQSMEQALDEIIKKLELGEEQFETAAVILHRRRQKGSRYSDDSWQPLV